MECLKDLHDLGWHNGLNYAAIGTAFEVDQ